MKKLYSTVIILVLSFAAVTLAAAPMAVHNKTGNWYDVKTDYYRCTFYVGAMYPVWFTSADGKVEFPRGFLLDWIKLADAPDTQLHYLRNDYYADVNIIENSENTLIVECIGKFCKSKYRFPGVTAYYRWTLKKDSPEIQLDAELKFDKNAPRKMCLVMLGCMAFDDMPFEKVQVGKTAPQDFRNAGKQVQAFVSNDGVMLINQNKMIIGVSTPAVAWNNAANRFFTYVSLNMDQDARRWNGQEPFKFGMKFRIEGKNYLPASN